MKQNTITYETGATSHAVNDLILFTDNTRELAEKRDKAYKKMVAMQDNYNRPSDFNSLEINYRHLFFDLMLTAMRDYKKEFPTFDDHKHVTKNNLVNYTPGEWTEANDYEYCNIYLNGFENWKLDHGYK
jgi:hypothetical protein